jgi:hypothetical protein
MLKMKNSWGVASFYGMGATRYLLISGEWLPDRELKDGDPVLLFATMEEADIHASTLPQDGNPHGVQFSVDEQGKVLTIRRSN